MKIIVDAMGGDHAPAEILKGAAAAVREYGVQVTAVGNEQAVHQAAQQHSISLQGIEIVHAAQQITMCDDPTTAIRTKKDSSMVVGMRLLAQGQGAAFVSAGSTGALLAGATLIVKRMKGVKRPAIGTVIPGTVQPYLLLDAGANVECRAEMLEAFGVMGSVYMERVMKRSRPRVALVNNGAEESKGTPVYVQAHALMKQNAALNFVGNIEPRDIPRGEADVVVCDGFTGNVILKLTEGLAKSFAGEVKKIFLHNMRTKLAYLLVKPGMQEFRRLMDADEHGGALMLGVAQPVIKAHGSSNEKAFKNAIRQAVRCVEGDVTAAMAQRFSQSEA